MPRWCPCVPHLARRLGVTSDAIASGPRRPPKSPYVSDAGGSQSSPHRLEEHTVHSLNQITLANEIHRDRVKAKRHADVPRTRRYRPPLIRRK